MTKKYPRKLNKNNLCRYMMFTLFLSGDSMCIKGAVCAVVRRGGFNFTFPQYRFQACELNCDNTVPEPITDDHPHKLSEFIPSHLPHLLPTPCGLVTDPGNVHLIWAAF